VLIIMEFDSVEMVVNGILGRADLRLRFCSGIWRLLPTDCGRMCAHLGHTGEKDLTRHVTHREAGFGPVIHSIFDAWQ